jgi:hypothetical protein
VDNGVGEPCPPPSRGIVLHLGIVFGALAKLGCCLHRDTSRVQTLQHAGGCGASPAFVPIAPRGRACFRRLGLKRPGSGIGQAKCGNGRASGGWAR